MSELLDAVYSGDVAAVTRRLAEGADASIEHRGMPLLSWAAQEGHVEVCQALLRHGANIAAIDSQAGFSALRTAAGAGHLPVIQLLLDAGADVHEITPENCTALEIACAFDNADVVLELVERGADMDRLGYEGHTAIWDAVANESMRSLKALALTIRGRAAMQRQRETLLLAAEESGNPDVLRVLRSV
jgi:ankyrin repeat protein